MFNILVVDDNQDICSLCEAILEDAGFKVTCVQSSLEAIKLISKIKYHGMVIDTYLPDINGVQLIAYIKSSFLNAATPIVSMSGEYNPVTQERLNRMGVLKCLSKPFRPESIVEIFHQHLGVQEGKIRYRPEIVRALELGVKDTLNQYLGQDFVLSDRGTVVPSALVTDVLSYLPLFGRNIFGSLVIRAERPFMDTVFNHLFGKEAHGLTQEAIGDLGAELANQCGGALKLELQKFNVNINIGLPNTVSGVVRSNYHFVSSSPYQFQVVWKEHTACFELALSDIKRMGASVIENESFVAFTID